MQKSSLPSPSCSKGCLLSAPSLPPLPDFHCCPGGQEAQEPFLPTAQGLGSAGDEDNAAGVDKVPPCTCSWGQGVGNYSSTMLLLLSPPQVSPVPAQPSWVWSVPIPKQWRNQQHSGELGLEGAGRDGGTEQEREGRVGFSPTLGTFKKSACTGEGRGVWEQLV